MQFYICQGKNAPLRRGDLFSEYLNIPILGMKRFEISKRYIQILGIVD
jgi:hypothetical protein